MKKKHFNSLKALGLAIALTVSPMSMVPVQAANSEMVNSLIEKSDSYMTGGWEKNTGNTSLKAPENKHVKKVFKKAKKQLMGVKYKGLAYLGSQVVAGTNYCILCKAKTVAPGANANFVLMFIYEDLDGNVSVTSVEDLL